MLKTGLGVLKSHIYIYIVVALLFSVLLFSNVHAEASETATVNYSVSVRSSLSLTLPTDPIQLNLNPSSKTFDSNTFNVVVGTNNETGYTLTLSTPNNSTDLNRTSASQDDNINAVIATLPAKSGGYTDNEFVANRWGYKITSNTSKPSLVTENWIPFASGITLMESDEADSGTATIALASKIDYDQPYGTYNTTLNFNLVANPIIVDYIQNLDPSLCTATPSKVTDIRDNEEYLVARLADGNCWMLDNLRLDPTEVSLANLQGNTNAPNNVLGYFKNGGGSSPYTNYGISKSWTSSSENYYDRPMVAVSGTGNNGDWTKNTVAPVAYGSGSGKIGVYYNFCAASAGSYCYSSSSSSGNAQYDICPAGWKMPSGGYNAPNGSYYYLYNTSYSANADNFKAALSIPFSGSYASGSASSQGSDGSFWSSTRLDDTGVVVTLINSSSVNVGNITANRLAGRSVRCILKPTMQGFTAADASAMAANSSTTLTDVRDGNDYTVTKINGNVWMTQNLRYVGDEGSSSTSMIMKSATSNIASDQTLTIGDLTSGDDYNNARIHVATADQVPSGAAYTATDMGVWYNYAAASAGFVTSDQNASTESTYSVCPAGWRLPTNSEQSGVTSYMSQYFNGGSAVTGGYYYDGAVYDTGYGYWWSSTASSSTNRYVLYYDWSSLRIGSSRRSFGFYVRCIFSP